jgi:hypothetical protein
MGCADERLPDVGDAAGEPGDGFKGIWCDVSRILPEGEDRERAFRLIRQLCETRDVGDAVGFLCQLDEVLRGRQHEE